MIVIIGNFTHNKAKDTYIGEIKTLTLPRSNVVFRPTQGTNGNAPDYRVLAEGKPGAVEIGAAWKRTSGAGREFLSVRLDDPALSHPLSAALMPAQDGTGAILIWSRPTKRRAKAA
jgi:uncharacterized protein (DUF736 family)